MNPIFSKRNKPCNSGSRPNILPTTNRGNNYRISRKPSSDELPISNSGGNSPFSPSPTSLTSTLLTKSPSKTPEEREKDFGKVSKTNLASPTTPNTKNSKSIDSRTSNQISKNSKGSIFSHKDNNKHEDNHKKQGNSKLKQGSKHGDMIFHDIEDDFEDYDGGDTPGGRDIGSNFESFYNMRIPGYISDKIRLDHKTWRDLGKVVNGNGRFSDGWIGQNLVFNSCIPFGLVQKKGGPCGVLAAIQGFIIRNILRDGRNVDFERVLLSGGRVGGENGNVIKEKRVGWLVDSVAEILWRCGESERIEAEEENKGGRNVGKAFIVLGGKDEVLPVSWGGDRGTEGVKKIASVLVNVIHRIDCVGIVYSAVLSRGVQGVCKDMDFEENSTLIGQHGYCAQELINLLCFGKAISNAFDNDIELDGKVLKGIYKDCDVGLLSLFEYYGGMRVGEYLKCPVYPVWIVCSESHYSVLFAGKKGIAEGWGNSLDLFYYDGLVGGGCSGLDWVVRLTLRLSQSSSSKHNQSNNFNSVGDELVPPLEKCIRTKWGNLISLDWNGVEPIL